MNLAALAGALRAVADAIEADDVSAGPRRYTSERRYGRQSWRAMRDTAARLGVPTYRVGRDVETDADAYDAAIATKRAEPRMRKPPASDDQAERMARLGLRAVAGGRGR